MFKLDLTLNDIETHIITIVDKNIFHVFIEHCTLYIKSNADGKFDARIFISFYDNRAVVLFDNVPSLIISKSSIYAISSIRVCDIIFFNENKDIILDLLCKEIHDILIHNFTMFNIKKKKLADRHIYNDILLNIKEYCRKEKLRIATNI